MRKEGPSVVVGGRGAQQERPVWRHRFEIRRDTGEPMDRGRMPFDLHWLCRPCSRITSDSDARRLEGRGWDEILNSWTCPSACLLQPFRSPPHEIHAKPKSTPSSKRRPVPSFPFNKLVLSQDYQARAGGSTPKMSIAELAASIKECGVLQNLVVVQGARGRYEVCAGGRRLEALTLLVGNGDLADNYPVPVLIVPADRALIASLSENCFHIPMHPADEFAAFRQADRARQVGRGRGRCLRHHPAGGQAPHETRHRLAQADGAVPRRPDRLGLPDGAGLGG